MLYYIIIFSESFFCHYLQQKLQQRKSEFVGGGGGFTNQEFFHRIDFTHFGTNCLNSRSAIAESPAPLKKGTTLFPLMRIADE
jgi:hypothetical protein